MKPGNAIELLAASLKISHLGEDLKTALKKWLQFDLWEKVKKKVNNAFQKNQFIL